MNRNIANKMVHYVVSNYQYAVFQTHNIHSWLKLFDRKILHISIRGSPRCLKKKAYTPIEVGRFLKTIGVYHTRRTWVELKLSHKEFI